jgi:CRP-like cAMP-binding protein
MQKDIIFRHGDVSTSVFVLLQGSASLELCGQRLNNILPCSLFGGVGVLEEANRRTSAGARCNQLIAITRQTSVSSAVATSPETRVAIIELSALLKPSGIPPDLGVRIMVKIGGLLGDEAPLLLMAQVFFLGDLIDAMILSHLSSERTESADRQRSVQRHRRVAHPGWGLLSWLRCSGGTSDRGIREEEQARLHHCHRIQVACFRQER